MIVRMWHGKTPKEKSEAYVEFLKSKAIPDYKSVEGNLGLTFLKRDEEEITHFLLVTYWNSFESIKKFAGSDPEVAKYYEEDKEFLLEKELSVIHYEVFFDSALNPENK
ncbi:MAG: antibiotic biosynthesis monooxygenase family protein [Candidatus Thorarchaeota archaeon]